MSNFGSDEITIRSLMLQRTGTFNDVYNRSFQMELDDHSRESVRQRIQNVGGGRITSKSFRGISSGLLVPIAEVDTNRDRVYIPDGWDRPRCRFMMEVSVSSRLGDESTYFFQGFTDHLGLTSSGNVDEKMVFFINGFIRVTYANRRTVRGTERFGIVKESAQVISGKLVYDRNKDTTLMRTVDLFSNIQERFYDNGYTESISDSRSVLASNIDSIFVKREDNLPGRYLASTLDTYRRNTDLLSFGTGTEDVLGRAQQELHSDMLSIQDNVVLRHLAHLQGVHNTTSFTLGDLYDLDPNVRRNGVIEGTSMSQKAISQLASTDSDVADWRAATTEARWATQIANGVAAIMMNNYYRSFDFAIDNLNLRQEIIIQPQDAIAVAENLPVEIFERMLDEITDLFYDLSGGNIDEFSVQVIASQYDQTELFVTVNGGYEHRFFVPSFADSLMSPFYTRDSSNLSNLSSDIESLLNELQGEITGSASALSVAAGV